MNEILSWEACSKYSNKFEVNIFFQPRYSAIVPYANITFAPERKISYKSPKGVYFETGRVYVGSQMSQKLTLVLMAGLPGAGKSTLAHELSNDLQWYLVNKDDYRKKFLQQGLNAEEASYSAYEEAFMKVRSSLTEHRSSVILDCVGLHDFIINNVMNIVYNVENVELKVILCVVDPGLRKDRLSKRPPERVVLNDDLEHDDDYFKIYKLQKDNTYVLHTDRQIEEHFENKTVEECLIKAKAFLDAYQLVFSQT